MQSFGLEAIAERNRNTLLKKWDAFTNFLEENRQHIFFLFVFYVITIALFIDRFVCEYPPLPWHLLFSCTDFTTSSTVYAFMSEHLDLRHVMGVGIAITRGSAAALSFNYCVLLLTMCRNLITKMKEHSLHQSVIHFF